MSAFEHFQFGVGDAGEHLLLCFGEGLAVVFAAADEGGAGDLGQSFPCVVVLAGFELAAGAHFVAGFVLVGIVFCHFEELGVKVGIGFGPFRRAARVHDGDHVARAGVGVHVLDFVQGV